MDSLLSPSAAHREAWRCLQCWDAPCTAACPVHIPIPEFIARLRTGDKAGADELLRMANPLVSSCGEICPDELYCSRACVLQEIEGSVRVRELHRYVTEHTCLPWPLWESWRPERIAVIGSGPAGISCARELARHGYAVYIFERDPIPGGILRYHLAVDRFPTELLDKDLSYLQGCGITWNTNQNITSLKSIMESYDAVFYAPGRYVDLLPGIPGASEYLTSGMEFLRSYRTGRGSDLSGKDIVVIGGGNVSLDVAVTAAGAGAASVILIYRRGPVEMPVWERERSYAEEHGVRVNYCTVPAGFLIEDGIITGLRCRRVKLVDAGEKRLKPVEIEGFDFVLPADLIITAIGMDASKDEDLDLAWRDKRYLPVDDTLRTSHPILFAGGDLVSSEGTVVAAAAHGKRAAEAIHHMFEGVIT